MEAHITTMKYLITLILLLIASEVQSQSVSVSPTSFNAWGNVTNTSEIAFQYKDFGIHYFHVWDSKEYGSTENGKVDVYSGWSQSTFAISYVPINIKDILKLGVIASPKNFPTTLSNHFNFWVEAGFNINRFRVSYVHNSNGFGILNKVNPGIDTIRLTIPLTR